MKKLTSLAVIIGLATSVSAFAANSENTGYYAGAKMGTSLEHIENSHNLRRTVPSPVKGMARVGSCFHAKKTTHFS
ncbi:hypothetical protein ACBQ19_14555, partial [Hafnia alvei]